MLVWVWVCVCVCVCMCVCVCVCVEVWVCVYVCVCVCKSERNRECTCDSCIFTCLFQRRNYWNTHTYAGHRTKFAPVKSLRFSKLFLRILLSEFRFTVFFPLGCGVDSWIPLLLFFQTTTKGSPQRGLGRSLERMWYLWCHTCDVMPLMWCLWCDASDADVIPLMWYHLSSGGIRGITWEVLHERYYMRGITWEVLHERYHIRGITWAVGVSMWLSCALMSTNLAQCVVSLW